ncbi:MAG: alpha/beta hydrolase [Rhodoferax sp.]|nr:alpha/beta hydrolase [Rhodoferax sp.]
MQRKDSEWFDRMYNNRARVPETPHILRTWAERSARVRQSVTTDLDVRYGSHASETLDVFPSRVADAPVLVFLHGGYWRALDKADHSFLAPPFVEQGACVVIPNYALCPGKDTDKVTVPRIVMQMVAALNWVWRHIRRYGGNPGDITVMGHSAGGQLAAMMLACNWQQVDADLPVQLVQKALSISGVYDLEPIRHVPSLPELKLTAEDARRCSPAAFSAPRNGLLYSVAGGDESEEFLRQNRLIQQRWGRRRVPVSAVLPGLHHFSVLESLIEDGSSLNTMAGQLMKRAVP